MSIPQIPSVERNKPFAVYVADVWPAVMLIDSEINQLALRITAAKEENWAHQVDTLYMRKHEIIDDLIITSMGRTWNVYCGFFTEKQKRTALWQQLETTIEDRTIEEVDKFIAPMEPPFDVLWRLIGPYDKNKEWHHMPVFMRSEGSAFLFSRKPQMDNSNYVTQYHEEVAAELGLSVHDYLSGDFDFAILEIPGPALSISNEHKLRQFKPHFEVTEEFIKKVVKGFYDDNPQYQLGKHALKKETP